MQRRVLNQGRVRNRFLKGFWRGDKLRKKRGRGREKANLLDLRVSNFFSDYCFRELVEERVSGSCRV